MSQQLIKLDLVAGFAVAICWLRISTIHFKIVSESDLFAFCGHSAKKVTIDRLWPFFSSLHIDRNWSLISSMDHGWLS